MDALKLRIDTGVRKIEVNDNGDYIMLQVADQSIPAKLKKFVKAVEAKAAANASAISTLSGTVDTKASKTDLESAVNRIIALEEVKHEQITEAQIDAWFAQA